MKLVDNNLRIDFEPFSGSLTIMQGNDGSPLQQVFDGKSFNPNRLTTPCPVIPKLELKAVDNGKTTTVGNSDMGSMTWFVDGEDIKNVNGFKSAYEISDGSTPVDDIIYPRGTLILRYNVAAGEHHSLSFMCSVADPRTKKSISLKSNTLNLSTFDKSEDNYALSVEGGPSVLYNPWNDGYSLLLYKQSHGEAIAEADLATAKALPTSFVKSWTFKLNRGTKALTAGTDYTMKYYIFWDGSYKQIGSGISADITPVTSYSNSGITIDMRLMENCQLMARAVVDGTIVGEKTFGAARRHPKFTADYFNRTAINEGDKRRYDKLLVHSDSQFIESFSRLLRTIWHVVRANDNQDKIVGYGDDVNYLLWEDAGMDTTKDGEIKEYAEVEERPAHSIATDKDGNIYTDKDGNILIFH